jgi:hypothetical protein
MLAVSNIEILSTSRKITQSFKLERALIMSFPEVVLRPTCTAPCRHVIVSWYFCVLLGSLTSRTVYLFSSCNFRLQLAGLLDGDSL